jgi:hypothetical protein
MKTAIKSTTKDTLSQAELDATFDNGKVAITLVLKGKLPTPVSADPKKAAQFVQDLLAAKDGNFPGLTIDIYAGVGEDLMAGDDDE